MNEEVQRAEGSSQHLTGKCEESKGYLQTTFTCLDTGEHGK